MLRHFPLNLGIFVVQILYDRRVHLEPSNIDGRDVELIHAECEKPPKQKQTPTIDLIFLLILAPPQRDVVETRSAKTSP